MNRGGLYLTRGTKFHLDSSDFSFLKIAVNRKQQLVSLSFDVSRGRRSSKYRVILGTVLGVHFYGSLFSFLESIQKVVLIL